MRVRCLSLAVLTFATGLSTWPGAGESSKPAPKFPPELVDFRQVQIAPVFRPAPKQWDAALRERGWVLREDDQWKLYYTGYDATKTGTRRLGLATSRDGLAWTRYADNPLLADLWVEDMMVVKHEGQYIMVAEGKDDQAHWLTSDDGVKWTPRGLLDVRTTKGEKIPKGPYGTPTLFRDNDTWYLFYERRDAGIWLATSRDLKVWKHVRDDPIMTPGPAAYDMDMIALNQVIKHKGRYYAYYHGCATTGLDARKWSVGVATSTDLLTWEKYAKNPLTPVADNKSSGIVVPEGDGFRLYTLHPEVYVFQNPARKE